MSNKLKALGLGLIAAMAMSAMAVVNATAETGGHFVSSEAGTTNIVGSEGGTHNLHFVSEGGAEGSRIGCDNDSYTGSVSGGTASTITIAPSWSNCYTTGSPETKFDIHENGCHFLFSVGKNPEGHNTAHVTCPAGVAGIRITHPNCGIVVPPQTVTGVSYKNENDPHEVTLTSTVKNITAHYHSGICIFLGTKHSSEMNGSVTVKGFSGTDQVDVTATG
ncbi:MAG TPA: hypothetical protein VEQ41_02330 [Solirubrobacterales bacterium]|nr:hypothetical protein [Solirubrobacterales bacterium]